MTDLAEAISNPSLYRPYFGLISISGYLLIVTSLKILNLILSVSKE